jgi:hypothetical protein
MTNKKHQISIVKDEEIKKAIDGFKAAYKENKEPYIKEGVKSEDVENLVKAFSNKSAILATTVIISIMIALPSKEFIALMETAKSVARRKAFEVMKEVFEDKIKDTSVN